MDSLRKNTQIKKTNWPNRSSNEGDILDLRLAMFHKCFCQKFMDDDSPIFLYNFCAKFQKIDCRSELP